VKQKVSRMLYAPKWEEQGVERERENIFTEQSRQPRAQPPNLEDHLSLFMFPSERVTQL
jgi:hypothetical protein